MEEDEILPIKQLNLEDQEGVLHQYEIKDAKSREDIDSAKILNFDNDQFSVAVKERSIDVKIQSDIENQGNYLRGDGTWYDLSGVMDENFENTHDYINEVSSWVPSLSEENDYLKVSLTRDGETLSGGMIGGHNINVENAGKVLRINTEGTDLELANVGLIYENVIIPEIGEPYIARNCKYNTFTNLNVIPGDVIDLTINLPPQPESKTVYHAMIQFKCDTGNKLANVILKYGLNDYFNVFKVPESYIDDKVYQIVIYNDCATILPFGDTTVKKKDSEQDWILNEYSELLHFFKDMGDEGEVHNASPVDRPEFGNNIIDIKDECKLAIMYDNSTLNNIITTITTYSKLAIGLDNMNIGNKITSITTIPNLAYGLEHLNLGNSIITIEDIEEQINGD